MIFENRLRRPFRYTFVNATLFLVAINVLAHFIFSMNPELKNIFSLNVLRVVYYHWLWQPLTYMFVHGDIRHLFFNMIGLLIFGLNVEKAIGSKEFVLMYLLCGVVSGLFSLGVYYLTTLRLVYSYGLDIHYALIYTSTLVGASGAIYSLLLAYAVIYPRGIVLIWGLIPVPAPVLVIAYAVIEFGSHFVGGGNVAHLAHLFGFVAAWCYFLVRMGINPYRVWKDAYR